MSEPLYYMRDNHTFKRLSNVIDIALEEVMAEFNAGYSCGMLCTKRDGVQELHANGMRLRDQFEVDARAWLEKNIIQEER